MKSKDRILNRIYDQLESGKKLFTVLVDPDKYDDNSLLDLAKACNEGQVHYFFVGGSLMTTGKFERTIDVLKSTSDIPIVIFPGSSMQISARADAILFLSLISGRNPEYLIGQQVLSAPHIKAANLESLATGYMLIESENSTTANYISNTLPIPSDKADIAACTAMAGEMLGMKLIYLDGGSGAQRVIPARMVKKVKEATNIPIIVGGGITSAEQANQIWSSGADMIVVGNAIERDLKLVTEISVQLKSAV